MKWKIERMADSVFGEKTRRKNSVGTSDGTTAFKLAGSFSFSYTRFGIIMFCINRLHKKTMIRSKLMDALCLSQLSSLRLVQPFWHLISVILSFVCEEHDAYVKAA